jgi:superfamily II DNA or RNA helicase
MVETVKRRLHLLQFIPDLIIIDEAHKGNFFKVLDHFPNSLVIGATATPIHKKLYKYYTHIVQVIDIPELIEQGFLSKCRAFQRQQDLSDLKIDKGEFTDESLMNHYNKKKLYDGVVEDYLKECNGKKTIVFNCNIEHSDLTAKAFNDAGIRSYSITSKTSDEERAWILKEFKEGGFMVLNNCGILTTGYDEPSIENIMLNRATNSLTLFLQMIGRGSRIFPNKLFFTVFDYGLNHDRHGLWAEARKWSLEPPKKKRKASAGVAPIKYCPSCGAILGLNARSCEFCGHALSKDEEELLYGKLVEVVPANIVGKKISEVEVEDLIILHKEKIYKSSYIFRVLRSRGEEAIRKFAEIKEFKLGWITHQVGVMQEEAKNGGTKFSNYKIESKKVLQ